MALRWLQVAITDLRGIHRYIARDNPTAAKRVISAIRDEVETLKRQPGIGRAGRIDGTRELVVTSYPYIVAYRINEDDIHVLAVVHTSRRWPEQLPS